MKQHGDVAELNLNCPVPFGESDRILLAHGSGGKLTHDFIEREIMPCFRNPLLEPLHDGAIFAAGGMKWAFTTDSYVVDPIFFPGGDIGSLAVNGTVNDLAMCGAVPWYLSAAMVIEEGFPMDDLRRVIGSMRDAALRAGVLLVTGDTKVVGRGKADKLFITTSGVGRVREGVDIDPKRAVPGDRIVLSGNIGEHGMAVMSVREGLDFETELLSDTAPLGSLVSCMLDASRDVHVLRDPTRGGIATSLNEIAGSANAGIVIEEDRIPVSDAVRGACEILGFDPLYVANEGKLLAVVPEGAADAVMEAMRSHPLGLNAEIIGEVVTDDTRTVTMKTSIGTNRIIDMLTGEQLPRIC